MKNKLFVLLSFMGVFAIALFFVGFQNSEDWIAPAEADNLKNPFEGSKKTSAMENLFSFNCERCHGSYGKGDGVDGKKLKPKPADLTSEKVQKQSDGAIFWKLSNGKGEMDAFKNKLTEKERWQLVTYIRELGKH
ncbi:MAG: c-type cytochrome [Bacteroidia bacterium]